MLPCYVLNRIVQDEIEGDEYGEKKFLTIMTLSCIMELYSLFCYHIVMKWAEKYLRIILRTFICLVLCIIYFLDS
jgi:uncharacterized membrane protein